MEKEYWFALTAGIFYGTITVGGQFFADLGLSLYEISLFRVIIAAAILLPIVLIYRQYIPRKGKLPFLAAYGLIGAFAAMLQFAGVVIGAPVAVVVLLLYSQTIWTAIISRLVLKEKITNAKKIAVTVAFGGIILLLQPWSLNSTGPLLGIACALLAGVFMSGWIIFARKSGINKLHPVTTTLGWASFSAIWMLVMWPFAALLIAQPSITRLSFFLPSQYWLYLGGFVLISTLIPHILFFRVVGKLQASIACIVLCLSPLAPLPWLPSFSRNPSDSTCCQAGP